MKFQVGSSLLGLNNCHDNDFIVIVEGDVETYKQQYFDEKDTFMRSKENLDSTMLFQLPFNRKTIRWYIVNYQLDKDIIKQDFPIEYHILDRRYDYIRMLNWILDNKACNFSKCKYLNDGNCSKMIYHIAYLIFILENNSTTITAEQKEIVQKIHDLQMPQSYLDELEEIIRSLR